MMRVPIIILLAIISSVSAQSSCEDGGDPSGDPELGACIMGEIAATTCTDQGCVCTQGGSITSCYSQFCGGYVPTGVAAKQSADCLDPIGGTTSQLSPIAYLGTTPIASPTSASPVSASGVLPPSATSLVAVISNTTASATAASAPTFPSSTSVAPSSTEPPTHTVSDPPTPTASGAAQPAASKAAANLGFIAPAGGALAAVLGLMAYL